MPVLEQDPESLGSVESELPVSMSETTELPPEAPLDANPARALYFGSFDKEWIPFLPKPGTYVHEVYGDMDLSPTAYDEMLQNFNNYVYKQDLPIRATHTPQDSGAVGWIKPGGMRIASDGSLEVKPEWNDLGRGLVDGDRFRYVSAEFCKNWTNPVTQEQHKNVAVGLALVTRPHFKTDVLNPLSESEALAFAEASQDEDVISNNSALAEEGTQMPEPEIIEPIVAATTETEVTPPVVVAPPEAPAVVLSDLSQVVISAEQRSQERQMFADLNTRVDLAERRATTAEARLKEIEAKNRQEKFKAEVLGRSAENGNPWLGSVEGNVGQLVSLAEQFGEDSPQVLWTITQKRNEAQAIKSTGLFEPLAFGSHEDGASITAQVTRLAEQVRNSDSSLSMEAAINKVYQENPELYIKSLKR